MRKPILIAFACLTCLVVAYFLFAVKNEDKKRYADLVASAQGSNGPLLSFAEQERKGVCKELWLRSEKNPLHIRIVSEKSDLFLFNQENKVEVVEEMSQVKCVMQEELFYLLPDGREAVLEANGKICLRDHPEVEMDLLQRELTPMQHVRYFEAENATYNYNSQIFFGEEVKLWRYRLAGHDARMDLAGEIPLMKGVASSVEFSLKGEDLNFAAVHLKATFDTRGGYR